LLPYEVVVETVLELQPDKAECIDGVRTDIFQPRCAGDRDFQRNRDVTLDLFGRLARPLAYDLDDRRRRVRISLDIKRRECRNAQRDKRGERRQHERPPRQA
jgi:hypothetical protein